VELPCVVNDTNGRVGVGLRIAAIANEIAAAYTRVTGREDQPAPAAASWAPDSEA
jgi:hypothetical protein